MPAIWQRMSHEFSIVVWQSSEPMTILLSNLTLTSEEKNEWESFLSLTRQREWLTVRNALKVLLPPPAISKIEYNENGKPQLNGRSISISHSKEFVAVMISKDLLIGIDLEVIHPRIEKLAQKFLNEKEIKSLIGPNQLEKMHVMWGAKEVLYKIHSIGNIDFKRDLIVHPFKYNGTGNLKATLAKKGYEADFKISYSRSEKYMLTWGME